MRIRALLLSLSLVFSVHSFAESEELPPPAPSELPAPRKVDVTKQNFVPPPLPVPPPVADPFADNTPANPQFDFNHSAKNSTPVKPEVLPTPEANSTDTSNYGFDFNTTGQPGGTIDPSLPRDAGNGMTVKPTYVIAATDTFTETYLPMIQGTNNQRAAYQNNIGHSISAALVVACFPGATPEERFGYLDTLAQLIESKVGLRAGARWNLPYLTQAAAHLACKQGDRPNDQLVSDLVNAYRETKRRAQRNEFKLADEWHNLVVAAILMN